jgi:hypothetical protein
MSAKVSFLSQPITAADQQPVPAVNPRALAQRDGRSVVFALQEDQTVRAVPVTPGRQLGDLKAIGADPALRPGQRLVLDPPAALRDGDAVTVAAK